MHPLAALDHLLNFALPALCVAALVAMAGRFLWRKTPPAHGWRAHAAINFVVGLAALAGGLVLSGHDGRMASWAALVLAVATSEWILRRGWKG